jgi:hypothetical protein
VTSTLFEKNLSVSFVLRRPSVGGPTSRRPSVGPDAEIGGEKPEMRRKSPDPLPE